MAKRKAKQRPAPTEKKPEPPVQAEKPKTEEQKVVKAEWEDEIVAAEKKEYDRMHGGPGGRPLFNGRPIRDVVRKLEDVFKLGGGVTEACAYADIPRTVFYDFVKDKPSLTDRFEALQNLPTVAALNCVTKALPTNPGLAFTFIERRMHKKFGEKKDLNVNVKSASFSVNAQLIGLKAEFDKRFLDTLNQADIKGQIPPDSDDYSVPAPPQLLEGTDPKVVQSKEQGGGEATSTGS